MSSLAAGVGVLDKRRDSSVLLLLSWILANIVGGAMGVAAAHVISDKTYRGIVIWAGIGVPQALVLGMYLKNYLPRTQAVRVALQWIGICALGGLAAVFTFQLTTLLLFDTGEEKPLTEALWAGTALIGVAGAVAGAVLATAQYFVLRGFVLCAYWWVIANAIAWAVSLVAGAGLLERYVFPIIYPYRLFYWSTVFGAVYADGPPAERILSISVVMAVQGLITGLVLIRLLHEL
jgi:hypothetical protein